MYKQEIKKWVICVTFILILVFLSAALTNIVKASAEEDMFLPVIVCDSETQIASSDMSASTASMSSDEDKEKEEKDDNKSAVYKNLGADRLLQEGEQGLTQLHYIENANYFLANPKHHENDTSDNSQGTCTTVALQILVGYHNYYSDRRLIPEINDEGKRLLKENYGDLNEHPLLLNDTHDGLGWDSIGTDDNVYERIYEETFWGSFPGIGQAIGSVTAATENFLNQDSALNEDAALKNWTIEDSSYNKSEVIDELDAGRPVIIVFDFAKRGNSHVVVAYGYAQYNNELCYITHYGWRGSSVQMLVPESWLAYQVTMSVDHVHTYELIFGENYTAPGGIVYNAMECEVCGCTTLVDRASLFAGGTGTISDPFLISNAEQFRNIGFAYTSVYVPREGMENQITYAFKLTNNIVIPGDWTPFPYKFAGNFDGNGCYISYAMHLTQSEVNDSDKQGLFGFVISPAQIYDLELINCTITSDVNTVMSTSHTFVGIGILAGSVYSASGISDITVTNPKIECKISGASIGALAGSLQATSVTNCVVREVNGTAAITNNTHGYLGGMAGMGDIGRFSGGRITISLTNKEFNADNDMMGKVVGNAGDTVPADMIANVTMDQGDTCIAAGTLITLADGTQKAVEDLTGNEMLLVWNLQTGQFDSAPILFIDSDPAAEYSVINLYFSDGTQTKVISEHGFWDHDLNEYVYLDKDAAQYIGHWFNILSTDEDGSRVTEKVQLANVVIQNEYTVAYSPVTYGHLCYYVNGMLSMPGGIEGLFNIFEADAETMKYDEAQMQADIAQYGLFTYEEFAEIFPISEEVFEAFNGQYLKVAMGKGLIDAEGLQILIERYAEFLSSIE